MAFRTPAPIHRNYNADAALSFIKLNVVTFDRIVAAATRRRTSKIIVRWIIVKFEIRYSRACIAALLAASMVSTGVVLAHSKSIRVKIVNSQVESQPLKSPSIEPFGLGLETVTWGSVFEKWTELEAQLAIEREILMRCRESGIGCPGAAMRFQGIVDAGLARAGRARIGVINRAVNLAIRWSSDVAQFGARWSTPLQILAKSQGDCKDYAIVKFLALEEAGIAPDDLRIVIVHNLLRNEDHAVLAVRYSGQWLILDNSHLALATDFETQGVVPLFALGHFDRDGFMPFVVRLYGTSVPS